MTIILSVLFVLCIICAHAQVDMELNVNSYCYDAVNTRSNSTFTYVEVELFENIALECHKCYEKLDPLSSVVWVYGESNALSEVPIGLERDTWKNRIEITRTHALILKNATINDTNTYYCRDTNAGSFKVKYSLETVFPPTNDSWKGPMSDWIDYEKDQLSPVNVRLRNSTELNELPYSLQVYSEWDKNWTTCMTCNRAPGRGTRTKTARCYVIVTPRDHLGVLSTNNMGKVEYLRGKMKISCRSRAFARNFPLTSNLTREIVNFVASEHCSGICRPDSGAYIGWKTGKTKQYKYKRTLVLNQGDHLIVICPESSISNTIVWRKNGRVLDPGRLHGEEFLKARLIVDAYSTLYLSDVTVDESGNYTCVVDNINMQQLRVIVIGKNVIFTDEMKRYLTYLTLILIVFTTPCYCAGIYAQVKTRFKFIKIRHKYKHYKHVSSVDMEDLEII